MKGRRAPGLVSTTHLQATKQETYPQRKSKADYRQSSFGGWHIWSPLSQDVVTMDVCTARIAQLSEYFDALADLVPFKHYVDTDDYVDVRSMKKKDRVQAKATFKQQHKVAKRAKLDPDAEVSTTKAQRDAGGDRDQNGAAPLAPWLAPAITAGAMLALCSGCRSGHTAHFFRNLGGTVILEERKCQQQSYAIVARCDFGSHVQIKAT